MRFGNETPIEDYLDEVLRRSHTDARATRRLIDEAGDHLSTAAAQFQATGMTRVQAERAAVRRFGPVDGLTRRTWRACFARMVMEVLRGAMLLGGCALVAVGVSGGIVAVMNALAGDGFVGGVTVLGAGGHSITETAQDAVALRVLAGLVGAAVLACYRLARDYAGEVTVLPRGLIDALGAAAFAAGTVALTAATIDQAVTGMAGDGVGFFLSGAVASLAGAAVFCTRATRAILPHHRGIPATAI